MVDGCLQLDVNSVSYTDGFIPPKRNKTMSSDLADNSNPLR
jgi:hypothetical protein